MVVAGRPVGGLLIALVVTRGPVSGGRVMDVSPQLEVIFPFFGSKKGQTLIVFFVLSASCYWLIIAFPRPEVQLVADADQRYFFLLFLFKKRSDFDCFLLCLHHVIG